MGDVVRRFAIVFACGITSNFFVYLLANGFITNEYEAAIAVSAINVASALALAQLIVLIREYYSFGAGRLVLITAFFVILIAFLSTFKANFIAGLPIALALTSLLLPHAPLEVAGVYLFTLGYGIKKKWMLVAGLVLILVAAVVEVYVSTSITDKIIRGQAFS